MKKILIAFVISALFVLLAGGVGVMAETNFDYTDGNSIYRIYDEPMTWKEAKAFCENQGGHLVIISTEKEQEFISSILEKDENSKNCYWIGLRKYNEAWTWIDDSTIDYENWASNEPNMFDSYEEAYVHIFGQIYTGGNGIKNIGEWNDASNTGAGYAGSFYDLEEFGFICEWDYLPNPVSILSGTNVVVGKAKAGATVNVKYGKKTYKNTADAYGNYRVKTAKLKTGKKVTIWQTVEKKNSEKITVKVVDKY